MLLRRTSRHLLFISDFWDIWVESKKHQQKNNKWKSPAISVMSSSTLTSWVALLDILRPRGWKIPHNPPGPTVPGFLGSCCGGPWRLKWAVTLVNGWLKAAFSACGWISLALSHPDQGTKDISDSDIFLQGHRGIERICVVVTPSLAACSLLRFQKPLRILQRLFWFKRALLPTHFLVGFREPLWVAGMFGTSGFKVSKMAHVVYYYRQIWWKEAGCKQERHLSKNQAAFELG